MRQDLPRQLNRAEVAFLRDAGWFERAGSRTALWVRADRQQVPLIRGRQVAAMQPCSTARADVTITLRDESGAPAMGWKVFSTRVLAMVATDRAPHNGGNMVESLGIACERIDTPALQRRA